MTIYHEAEKLKNSKSMSKFSWENVIHAVPFLERKTADSAVSQLSWWILSTVDREGRKA